MAKNNKKRKSQAKPAPVQTQNQNINNTNQAQKSEAKQVKTPEVKQVAKVKARNSEFQAEFKKKALRLGGTLFAVTAVTGFILGIVHWVTDIAIKEAERAARNVAFQNVMPAAKDFETMEVAADDFVAGVQKATDESGIVGYCLTVNSKGYGGNVNFIVGITKDGTIKAINIMSHSETPGLGARSTEPEFYEQFNDRKAPLKVVKGASNGESEISAISGATITSNAVTNGVNAAFEYWQKNLK